MDSKFFKIISLALVAALASNAQAKGPGNTAIAPTGEAADSSTPDPKDPSHGALEVHETPLELGGVSTDVKGDVASAAPAEENTEDKGSFGLGAGLFGIHAAVGLPHPVTFGLDWQPMKLVTVNLDMGKFGLKVGSQGTFDLTNFELTGRFHPFSGSFFVGAAFGRQSLSVSATKSYVVTGYADQDTTLKIAVKSTYWTPMLGWVWGAGNSGLTFGMEFGYLMPLSPKATTTVTMTDAAAEAALKATPEFQKQQKDSNDLAEKLGKASIPFVTLLRIGYLF